MWKKNSKQQFEARLLVFCGIVPYSSVCLEEAIGGRGDASLFSLPETNLEGHEVILSHWPVSVGFRSGAQ